ncbi:MAG: hypothetical protein ABI359_13805, partial [Ginsengibacter sp.]
TTGQIENYISEKAAFNYNKVFDQYLRTTQMPVFEYYLSGDHQKVFYRYTNCVKGFNLPLTLQDDHGKVKILPTAEWKSYRLKKNESVLFDKSAIEAMYCVTVVAKDPTALIK